MHQLCREFVLAKRIAAGLIQIGQPLVLKQQKQESLTCFIRFYLTVTAIADISPSQRRYLRGCWPNGFFSSCNTPFYGGNTIFMPRVCRLSLNESDGEIVIEFIPRV